MLSLSACVLYMNIVGVFSCGSPMRSSRMMTMVRPAGATFFCAPAYKTPNLETSIGRLKMQEEMSATSGTLPVSGSAWNTVP